jgi:hypothetical protein
MGLLQIITIGVGLFESCPSRVRSLFVANFARKMRIDLVPGATRCDDGPNMGGRGLVKWGLARVQYYFSRSVHADKYFLLQ